MLQPVMPIICVETQKESIDAAILSATRQAGLEPSAIDYINAHGTSPYNDRFETGAINGPWVSMHTRYGSALPNQ